MTLLQVKQDIGKGISTRIYYSTRTLWWTHLDEDVMAATEFGKQMQELLHQSAMARTDIPEQEKRRMDALLKLASKSSVPLDPTGAPLYQMDDPVAWIKMAEDTPGHFGKAGLEAFMNAHHQNCNNKCFTKWGKYQTNETE